MSEEKKISSQMNLLKVQQFMRPQLVIQKDLLQRPIEIKIEEIRRKLKTMVNVKPKPLICQVEKFEEKKNEGIGKYNLLNPRGSENALPQIKKQKNECQQNKNASSLPNSFSSNVKLTDSSNCNENKTFESKPFSVYQFQSLSMNLSNTNRLNIIKSIQMSLDLKRKRNRNKQESQKQISQAISKSKFQFKQGSKKYIILVNKDSVMRKTNVMSEKQQDEKLSPPIKQEVKFTDYLKKSAPSIIPPQRLKIKKSPSVSKQNHPARTHQDFTSFVALCNEFYFENNSPFTFYLGKGNNPELIKKSLRKRGWIETNLIEEANLVWTQKKQLNFIEGMKQIHFTQIPHKETNIKTGFLFQNRNQSDSWENNQFPYQKLLMKNGEDLFQVSEIVNNKRNRRNKLSFCKDTLQTLKDCQKIQIHNHFANHHELAFKQSLFWNLKNYYEKNGKYPFSYIPMTFHIKNVYDEEWKRFREKYEELSKEGQLWIIKPAQNTNRGMGIYVKETLEEIQLFMQQKMMEKPDTGFILQEYLKPMLYNRRKFDIRSYMLVTVVNKKLRAYWYEEGYARTSSKTFNNKNLKNRFIHLTNDAIQKNCEDFGKFQPGNKLSFDDLKKYLEKQSNIQFEEDIVKKMIILAQDSIVATSTKIHSFSQNFCFELFGLDYMVDENGKVWLIEINRNPCLETQTSLMFKLLTNLVEDMFRIALDPLFSVDDNNKTYKQCGVDHFQSNKFRVIYEQSVKKGSQEDGITQIQ